MRDRNREPVEARQRADTTAPAGKRARSRDAAAERAERGPRPSHAPGAARVAFGASRLAPGARRQAPGAARCRRKFLRAYPGGFADPDYLALERGYKWSAHRQWEAELGRDALRGLLRRGEFVEAAARAVRIESRTNLLFSFEKMAVRDAVRGAAGARAFMRGLYELLHGAGDLERRFERWCDVVAGLPRRQTRVATWPVVTVFGFLAAPRTHVYLKPVVTRTAARAYGFDFEYASRPGWATYASLLELARTVRRDLADLRPRDMIDVQSFLWVQGSDEYAE